MNKFTQNIKEYWYRYLVGMLFAAQALAFLIYRDESYIQVHDNLDLFMPHFQMLSLNHAWFSQNATMPMLHGIDRNLLGSEFLLYNILYIIFPGIWAYLIGYALKLAIGMWGFVLLAKDILGERYEKYQALVTICAAAFSMIPVFPTYGIAFVSVPIIIWLVRRLYLMPGFKALSDKKQKGQRILLFLGVFCYPILSYFSYHGFFILSYMCVAVIILWIKDKKFPLSTFSSVVVLALGYVAFEYRLFKAMLFDDTVTIRTTMARADLSLGSALKTGLDEFIRASFHSQDSHTYVILPIVIIAIVLINIKLIKANKTSAILSEPVNLVMLWIIFNCLIFGLCSYMPFRTLLETIVPPLKGFDFSRTSFFNPFLWYVELLLVGIKMYDVATEADANGKIKKSLRPAANVVTSLAVVVVMLLPQTYNDFYYTVYNQAYKILKHKETSTVNYREFYSEVLFDHIEEDMGYDGEWSVAYGIHPAVLVYNGISTLDGYLGMYAQDYKEAWMDIEKEAFEGSPSLKQYYEEWGARVCLYSGSDENTYAPLRNLELEDERLVVDIDGLKALDCKYIFSRVEFSNADELGVKLAGVYNGDNSPYTIYVYELQ